MIRLRPSVVADTLDEMGHGMGRAVGDAERAMAWLWNRFKALPGVHQVGHGLATVLGLYRIIERADFETVLLLRIAAVFSGLAVVLFLVDHV